MRRADEQAIGGGERRQHRAVLRCERRNAWQAVGIGHERRADVVLAAVVGTHIDGEHRRLGEVRRRRAEERGEERAEEQEPRR